MSAAVLIEWAARLDGSLAKGQSRMTMSVDGQTWTHTALGILHEMAVDAGVITRSEITMGDYVVAVYGEDGHAADDDPAPEILDWAGVTLGRALSLSGLAYADIRDEIRGW